MRRFSICVQADFDSEPNAAELYQLVEDALQEKGTETLALLGLLSTNIRPSVFIETEDRFTEVRRIPLKDAGL